MMSQQINTQPKGFPPLPSDWKTEYETLERNGFKFFCVLHIRKEVTQPKNILVVCHGFGEHSGRYEHFPYFLKNSVDAIFIHDQRGHGRSQGQRGHVEQFDDLVHDQIFMIEQLHRRFPQTKIHFFAHSMGGHVGLRVLFLAPRLPIQSAQISSPFLALKYPVSIIKKGAARLLSRLWGNLSLSEKFDANVLSRDPHVVEHYQNDRLNHGNMTPRFYTSMTYCWKDTLKRRKGIVPPIQLLLPKEDTLVDGMVSQRFFEQLEHYQKNICHFDEMRHEGFNDLGKEKFFQKVDEWIHKYS